MKSFRITRLTSRASPQEKIALTLWDIKREIEAVISFYDGGSRRYARKVLREAFDIEEGSAKAQNLSLDAINDLQPRLDGALAIVRALRIISAEDSA